MILQVALFSFSGTPQHQGGQRRQWQKKNSLFRLLEHRKPRSICWYYGGQERKRSSRKSFHSCQLHYLLCLRFSAWPRSLAWINPVKRYKTIIGPWHGGSPPATLCCHPIVAPLAWSFNDPCSDEPTMKRLQNILWMSLRCSAATKHLGAGWLMPRSAILDKGCFEIPVATSLHGPRWFGIWNSFAVGHGTDELSQTRWTPHSIDSHQDFGCVWRLGAFIWIDTYRIASDALLFTRTDLFLRGEQLDW